MNQKQTRKLLQTFQKHLQARNKHTNTIRSYSNDLVQFFKWARITLGEEFTVDEVTRSDLGDFRTFLLTRRISSTSVNRRVTALRQFFDFCLKEGMVEKNPAAELAGIPNIPQAPAVLSKRDALSLIRTAEQSQRFLESSIILLLLHAGLRSSEICSLTIGDLHLTPRMGRLFIRGQRGKTMRFVYMSTRCQSALRLFCKRQGISILLKRRRSEPLFTLPNGNLLTQQSVDHIIKRTGKASGIPDITPTMLRNTCAIQALMQGESEESVARSLGIASVKTLSKYARSLQQNNGASRET
jgi:integrase/recombinase XerD